MKHSDDQRDRRAVELSDYLVHERGRILNSANSERLEQLHAAERSREVYRAWNAVCGDTREGGHVTGLSYLPSSNQLLVYLDGPAWTQEMTMLREIIRGRMAREGVELDGFVFKTSQKGYTPARERAAKRLTPPQKRPAPAHEDLSDEERDRVARQVEPIEDERLRDALKRAMTASLEWKKGMDAKKRP